MTMTELQNPLSFILEHERLLKSFPDGTAPSWLRDLRRENLSLFMRSGFPSTKDEEWKYTNLAPMKNYVYTIAPKNEIIESAILEKYYSPEDINIVFVNGILSEELSQREKLPPGITINPLAEALTKNESEIHSLMTKEALQEGTPFLALNQAFARNGTYISVNDHVVGDKLIHLIHLTSPLKDPILTLPRNIINIGASSEVTLLESHISFSDEDIYFANALTDIFLNDNARLTYAQLQKESLKAFHISHTRVWQERNSSFNSFALDVGSAISRHNLSVLLNGEGASTKLNGLYCTNGTQLIDNHTCIDHQVANCASNQFYKGVLNGSSRAVFNGKILVRSAAQGTNSYQLNKNLLLGEDCHVDTKPQLEIHADDVKCSHGATLGQLNEDEIFYLQTRAIPRKRAVRILSQGFIEEILNTIQQSNLRGKCDKLLEPTFEALG
ncbi:MAG TPA: Fe-S cluster assembly protein SufD [Candidatus Omnitrophica bacterium]|nr:MAG: Fe-S cluster assembly protein SufD [Omnitrophica WOR_2 bacterium GWA2_45_18]OGX21037.1 MAG: Fe-S cluster assembly protein SufD [Omnitrophica WOR_2 bacterium GWC2_45_7]HBR15881.1 Fe-S cluster assembly protein SufD [Candidatus Omnitrophota bacterium]